MGTTLLLVLGLLVFMYIGVGMVLQRQVESDRNGVPAIPDDLRASLPIPVLKAYRRKLVKNTLMASGAFFLMAWAALLPTALKRVHGEIEFTGAKTRLEYSKVSQPQLSGPPQRSSELGSSLLRASFSEWILPTANGDIPVLALREEDTTISALQASDSITVMMRSDRPDLGGFSEAAHAGFDQAMMSVIHTQVGIIFMFSLIVMFIASVAIPFVASSGTVRLEEALTLKQWKVVHGMLLSPRFDWSEHAVVSVTPDRPHPILALFKPPAVPMVRVTTSGPHQDLRVRFAGPVPEMLGVQGVLVDLSKKEPWLASGPFRWVFVPEEVLADRFPTVTQDQAA